MKTEEILALIESSPFRRSPAYSLDSHIGRFIKLLLQFTNAGNDENLHDIYKAVPDFQRNNDKWTLKMKQGFIRNVIEGYRTTVILYDVVPESTNFGTMHECKIMDGLQRISAIHEFMEGEFTVYGLTYQELLSRKIITAMSGVIGIKIHTFTSQQEAIRFYIAINENITHSDADIDRAKKVLLSLGPED